MEGKVQKLEGVATLKVKVEVLFFSKTVSVTVRRELKGRIPIGSAQLRLLWHPDRLGEWHPGSFSRVVRGKQLGLQR